MDTKSFLASLTNLGVDVEQITLSGELRAVPAGQREHWSGGTVNVYKPVLSRLDLVAPGRDTPVMQFVFPGADAADSKAFWGHVVVPEGVNSAEASELARELIDHHRNLVGGLATTYEQIEKPNEVESIAAILNRRTELRIGLSHLVAFIAVEDELLDALMEESTEDRFVDIRFRRDSLLQEFRKQPCPRPLYDALRAEYAASRLTGLGFNVYYELYRSSEARFAQADGLTAEDAATVRSGAVLWAAEADLSNEDWIIDKRELLIKNLQVHPHFHGLARDRFADIFREVAAQASGARDVPRG